MRKTTLLHQTLYLFVLSILFSCSHKQISGNILTLDNLNLQTNEQFNFNTIEDLNNQIKNVGSLNQLQNQKKIVRILIAFQNLTKKTKDIQIALLPKSKLKLTLLSFCAAPDKAVPDKNEIYSWIKGEINIPFAKSIIKLYSQANSAKQESTQEVLWNLANKTYYEDYPDNLKTLLNTASSSAKFTIPSRARNEIINVALPEEVSNSINIVKGQYYSFKDFNSAIQELKSQSKIPSNYFGSTIPTTPIATSTVSSGYAAQTIEFYNTSEKNESIKLDEYYLKSVRKDVQPILLSPIIPNLNDLQKILDAIALKMLGHLGSEYPTLNAAEKKLVQEKPIQAAIAFYLSQIAESKGDSYFPGTSRNGKSDAFRHYVWSGLLTRDLSEPEAREFLLAHESNATQPIAEKNMDTANNEKGISAALDILKSRSFEDNEFFDLAKKEIEQGHLIILKSKVD